MENVQTMSDLMLQIQQRIDSIKASAMQQQTEMKQSLNECIEQSEAIQNQLVQSQQQLTSQLEYGTAVLIELEQGLQLDFSTEIAEFEQLCQFKTVIKKPPRRYDRINATIGTACTGKNHVPIKRIKSQNRYSLTRDWSGNTPY